MTDEKKLNYAAFWQRLLAHNIDLIPIIGLYYLYSLMPKSSYELWILASIYFTYHILFEISSWHATPGKRLVKIKVKSLDMQTPSIRHTVFRNFAKSLSLILLFGGFFMIVFNKRGQGLHDYLSNTIVLYDKG